MTNPEQTARVILEELQNAVAAKDLDGLGRLVSDDVVFFGTAEANLDRDQTMAYLAREMAREGIIRWEWNRVAILASAPGFLSFAALGIVVIENPAGLPDGDRAVFRLTCVAVREDDRWRLRHFHGSMPLEG
jgi:ketosteroid isomerase-like protein